MKAIITLVTAAFFVQQISGCCCRPDDFAPPTASSARAPAKPRPKPPEPEISVSAMELHEEYDKNEVLADELYKGKKLMVSGQVASIDKDLMDNIVLRLKTKNMFQSVSAFTKPEMRSQVVRMSKGENTVVVCRGAGMIVGSPVLRDCTVL
jgi:hypothetical protein